MRDKKTTHVTFYGYGVKNERTHWRPLMKNNSSACYALLLFFSFLIISGLCCYIGWIDVSLISGISLLKPNFSIIKTPKPQECPLRCAEADHTQTCPRDYPTSQKLTNTNTSSNITCPLYFRWIYEDLEPWKDTGITKDMVDRAGTNAHFRLVILNGKAYIETYETAFQTRDKFTQWGILQLLRRYPGRLPDLELMFNCNDLPTIHSSDYGGQKPDPPPLFKYSSDQDSLDIVFPDWSFWGWAELNIKPWEQLNKDLKEANKRIKWEDRVPYAYWKGNPQVSPVREELMKCNITEENDWKAHLFKQNWEEESRMGFKKSKLEDQCTYRYKIYIEGRAWSVSEKYILACDSMTLYERNRYYDFFSRELFPLQHYWPIRVDHSNCTSLKFAVEWGNNNTDMAKAIGENGSNFIQKELKMDYIYDYMFHLLSEYSKLLRFKPSMSPRAVEICPKTMVCAENGNRREFMEESMVKSPGDSIPCTMPHPFDSSSLRKFLEKKVESMRKVEVLENEYWSDQNQK